MLSKGHEARESPSSDGCAPYGPPVSREICIPTRWQAVGIQEVHPDVPPFLLTGAWPLASHELGR